MKKTVELYICGWSDVYYPDGTYGKSIKYFNEPYTTDEKVVELRNKAIEEYEARVKNEILSYPTFKVYWKDTNEKANNEEDDFGEYMNKIRWQEIREKILSEI